MSILVIFEQRFNAWNRMSFESLGAAFKISSLLNLPVDVGVLSSSTQLAEEAAGFGARTVVAIEHPLLGEYTQECFTSALEQLLKDRKPELVIFPHTYQVRDYAPRLAARWGRALLSDVIDVRNESGLVFVRQLFQGKLNADVRTTGQPVFVSVQAGAFEAATKNGSHSSIEKFTFEIEPAQIRSKPDAPFREAQRSVDLSAANVIVSVGRGIKEKENLPLIEELAQALNAELAASRPICDSGWLPMERQVGSSGQTVSPKLYLAVGISGAIQHLVGMKGSQTIVAINKDENAPIFEAADYAVVGDLFEIVPALTEEIKKVKSGS